MRNLTKPLQIFLWSYVFVYAVFSSLFITQVDVWWQLSEGAHILQTWSLPTGPVAAYGLPATPYVDEYAGYEVVLALLYKCAGFVGLWCGFAAIYLAIVFLPGATTGQKYPAFGFASTFALLAAVLLIRERLEQRPEIVGALLQVLLMVLLRASNLEKITNRTLGWLFLLFAVWTNVHDTFVFGFFTLGLWIASEWWMRAKSPPIAVLLRHGAMLAAVALLASMLHPYGPRRLLFPFLQASDPAATALSPEMWPISYFSTPYEVFLIALALLAWGIITTPGLPPWLIVFSMFSVTMSYKNFRFIDLTAISLLFVYAARHEPAAEPARPLPGLFTVSRDVFLCLLCLFMMLLDVFNVLTSYGELRAERRMATHGLRYASDIAEYPVGTEENRVPVLCGYSMGSYLSFEGNGHFRPLLDSGFIHFSDETKRYYFFVWCEPEALEKALDHLSVNYVLLDPDTFQWIPTLHRMPDWQFVACTANGMIWKRNAGGSNALSDADRAAVADAVAALLRNGNVIGAFTYSTLLDDPKESLGILAGYSGPPWTEAMFNSVRAWVASIPRKEIESFLTDPRCKQARLLEAILCAHLGPGTYDKFIARSPQQQGRWQWKIVAAEVLLEKGDRDEARKVFDSISPAPVSSSSYYRLWHAVHDGVRGPSLSRSSQWQTGDENETGFIDEVSARLNERIATFDEAPSQ